MKSKRAKDYIREQEKVLYTSRMWGDKVPAVPSVCALRAVWIAEEELEAAHRARRKQWTQTLKEIRGLLARGDADTARIVVNNLLIDMKDREEI